MMILGDRKTGCRFYEFVFHGYRSLLIENNCIRVCLLLDKGVDIFSFVYKPTDTEFVWTNPLGFSCLDKRRLANADFDCFSDNYLGGWFEILPNLGGECSFARKHFTGHSEVSNLPWDYTVLQDSEDCIKLMFVTRLSKYPFELRKYLTVLKDEPTLKFEEELKNLGCVPLEYMWAQHPNVGQPFLSDECDIELPFTDKCIPMPEVGSMQESVTFYNDVKIPCAAIRNRNTGLGIGFAWSGNVYKNAALWINAGNGCGHHHFGGGYIACILPCSSPLDGLEKASREGNTLILNGKETVNSCFTITAFKHPTAVKSIDLNGNIA